ncbi:MAG TPA: T9SS type A sorting domain-containing protein [Lentimicrobium sp.]|nr:T9SS type A sorting domain-containing protein [Lentimicrobium sp.]
MIRNILNFLFTLFIIFLVHEVKCQEILLLDRFNGNKVINDSIVTVYGTDPEVTELTMYFTMVNNTDKPLSLFLRKQINLINDSTIDYFCFGIKCWPNTFLTDYPDTIQPGSQDYTFASHVVHYRRFENPPLPPGKSSITYIVFDSTTYPEPVEAKVTVIYHLSGVGLEEHKSTASVIFPNPAINEVTVFSQEISDSEYTLYLYNSHGQLIQVNNINCYANRVAIAIEHLPSGSYYGKLISAKKLVDLKFLKN